MWLQRFLCNWHRKFHCYGHGIANGCQPGYQAQQWQILLVVWLEDIISGFVRVGPQLLWIGVILKQVHSKKYHGSSCKQYYVFIYYNLYIINVYTLSALQDVSRRGIIFLVEEPLLTPPSCCCYMYLYILVSKKKKKRKKNVIQL